ncbi:1-aminocyclopropane-1-carboxylate oxidase homolog [Eucalyptus grandis]|uniref:1-aminocyclopropane-1-carboxylate oxidase homolog n=1 Tax=Eucalyptus grandis TaxID=71139 RepID=UPI00192EEFDD|nr:1-aminocyclopropane-1-carboxylate oxidase homolog [Eucalyptus grandis]
MAATHSDKAPDQAEPRYDRESELKAFDTSRTGVKDLVGSRVSKLPYRPTALIFSILIGDLQGVHEDSSKRKEMVCRVCQACEDWGFFQVVNHVIGDGILSGIIDGERRFHKQESEVKKEL